MASSLYHLQYQGFIFLFFSLGFINNSISQPFHQDVFDTKNGLESSNIKTIYQDKKGFLWIGTDSGVSRFDGYSFKNYSWVNSLPRGRLVQIIESPDSTLWVQTIINLGIFDPFDETFTTIEIPRYVRETTINRVFFDSKEQFWILTEKGVFITGKEGWKQAQRTFDLNDVLDQIDTSYFHVKAIQEDFNGGVYFNHFNTVFHSNGSNVKELLVVDRNIEIHKSPTVRHLVPLDPSILLAGTKQGNIYRYSGKSPKLVLSLGHNSNIAGIATDKNHIYILGPKGLTILDRNSYREIHSENVAEKFRGMILQCILLDREGNLWIGSNGGVIRLKKNPFSYIENNKNLFSGGLYSLALGHNNELLIGANNGRILRKIGRDLIDPFPIPSNAIDHGQITHILPDSGKSYWAVTYWNGLERIGNGKAAQMKITEEINDRTHIVEVFSIFKDSQNRIWVGTEKGPGLLNYDNDLNEIRFTQPQNYYLKYIRVRSILEDKFNVIWLGTSRGLFFYTNGKFELDRSLPQIRYVNAMLFDKDGDLWVSSNGNGIFHLKLEDKNLLYLEKHYSISNGLQSNDYKSLSIDGKNRVWAGWRGGLALIDKINGTPRNFNASDGLQNKAHDYISLLYDERDTMWVATSNSLFHFEPRQIQDSKVETPLYFTKVSFAGKSYLGRIPNFGKEIKIPYDENSLRLEFLGINLTNPSLTKYRYWLKGNRQKIDTSYISGNRQVELASLEPGRYSFYIQASNHSGRWKSSRHFRFRIMQPWYKTWWAISLFMILSITTYWLGHKTYSKIKQNRERAVLFSMVSHEIRTPLQIILSISNFLREKLKPNNDLRYLSLIQSNVSRLMPLVDDFDSLTHSQLRGHRLKLETVNLAQFLGNISESFKVFAKESGINFKFDSSITNLAVQLDQEKVWKIISNLLKNAIKFTEKGGAVIFKARLDPKEETQYTYHILIDIVDTGIGIPKEQRAKIWDLFYQIEQKKKDLHPGLGIGLTLVKELTKAHKGQIKLLEKDDGHKGSHFSLRLTSWKPPLQSKMTPALFNEGARDYELQLLLDEKRNGQKWGTPKIEPRKEMILLIDDNPHLSQILKEHVFIDYNVVTAINGEEGFRLVKKYVPDLIVCDMVMPIMNGKDFIRKLKEEDLVNYIPIIIFSIKNDLDLRLDMYGEGVIEYLPKPFEEEELKLKVKNLLRWREGIKEKYREWLLIHPEQIQPQDEKEEYLKKIISIIKENCSNSNFGVDLLSDLLGEKDRFALLYKTKKYLGKKPSDVIQGYRLEQSKELLKDPSLKIRDIANKVGFTPAGLANTFRKEFGCTPSEWRKKKLKKLGKGKFD